MNRLFMRIRKHWRRIALGALITGSYLAFFLTWEIMGMYTDSQAIATGSFTLVLFWIGIAFSLGLGTLKISNLGFMGSQVSLSNPAIRFLGGGVLMLWNILVPQYYSISEPTATLVTHMWFDVEISLGAIGLFVFLSGFVQIFVNILNVKFDPGFNAPAGIPLNQLPYRIFIFFRNQFAAV